MGEVVVRWFSTNNLADRFGVTPRTLMTWEQTRPNGFPLPVKVNRRNYWREEEIVAWEQSLIASRQEVA